MKFIDKKTLSQSIRAKANGKFKRERIQSKLSYLKTIGQEGVGIVQILHNLSGSPNTKIAPEPVLSSFLQTEIQLLMRLDHPHVIKVYQIIEMEAEFAYVM